MSFAWAAHICRAQVQRSLKSTKSWVLSPALLRQATQPSPFLYVKHQSVSTSTNLCVEAQHKAHNHTPIWTAERVLSAALLGILPVAFVYPNTALDYLAAVTLTAHIHWGVEAIVIDYARPSVVGPKLAAAAVASVYFFSILTLGGLFYFNYSDVGLMQSILMLWKL